MSLLVDIVNNDVVSGGVDDSRVLTEEHVTLNVSLETEYEPIAWIDKKLTLVEV